MIGQDAIGVETPSKIFVPMMVACAFFMQSLDSTIVSTALPQMAASLHEDPVWLNLAVTSYLLSFAGFVPLSGWVADKFGARAIFGWSIVVFTMSSMACGASGTLSQLVIARICQGFGAALMVPVGRLVLLRTIEKSDLIRVMTFISVPGLLGPVLGPPLGGFIITYESWRWIFFINLPIGVLGVVLVAALIHNVPKVDPGPFDIRGFVLISLSLFAWMIGIETIGRGLFHPGIVAAFLLSGAIGFACYVRHARRTAAPIIDLRLLRIPTFYAATIGSIFFRAAIGAMPFLLPILFQVGFGMSPLLSGLLTFSSAAGAMLLRVTSGRILRHFGFRPVMIAHIWLTAFCYGACGFFQPTTSLIVISGTLLIGGFFRGLLTTAANTLAFADIPDEQMSRATSFGGMMQQLSASLGVALSASVLHLTLVLRGATVLRADDFRPVFVVTGLVVLVSLFFIMALPPTAGAEVSGHRARE